MARPLPDLSRLRPAGGKRSTKRDRILSIFLEQEGHSSADDLCDLVRRQDAGIGRATVYRTLQWMVEAGIARKVDFGEGRSRFEPSYRHPRHFHLICTTCHQSSEFLSSDVEALVEEIAAARDFAASQTLVQIHGVCEACRTGRTGKGAGPIDGATTELVFARDALRIAIATERSGLEFYTRAAQPDARPARAERLPEARGRRARASGDARGALPRPDGAGSAARIAPDVPLLQGRGERAVRRRREAAPRGRRRSAGAAHRHQVRARIAQVLQALRRAVRGLRGQADLPRVRRRRARAPRSADPRVPRAARAAGAARVAPPPPTSGRHSACEVGPLIDLHTHTTASDGRRSPASLVAAAASAGVTVLGVTDHDTVAGCAPAAAACADAGIEFVPGIELTSVRDETDVHVLGYFIDTASPALASFLADQRRRRLDRVRQMILRLAMSGIELDADAVLKPGIDDPATSAGRPWIARALVERGYCATTGEAFERWLSRGRPAFVPRLARAARRRVRAHPRRRRRRLDRASRARSAGTNGFRSSPRRASMRSRRITPSRTASRRLATSRWPIGSASPCQAGRIITATNRTARSRPAACRSRAPRTTRSSGGRRPRANER